MRRNDRADDARALHAALTDLIRVYQFRDRDAICCYDVSPSQSHALERIATQGPLTINELAALLFLEKSSASRLADGLERKGYVTRSPHPDDGRYVQLDLTKRGRVLAQRIERDLVAERALVLADLTPDERTTVIGAIARLAEAAACGVTTTAGVPTRVVSDN